MSDEYCRSTADHIFLLMEQPDLEMVPDTWPPRQSDRPRWYLAGHGERRPDDEAPALSMAEAWQRHHDAQTLMTADQRAAEDARNYERLINLEAAAKLAVAIDVDEAEAIREEIERWQKLD